MAPKSGRRSDVAGWWIVASLILLQFFLFRQYALREVAWSYPPNHDQLGYLDQSYTAYERMAQAGLWRGLEEGARFVPPPPIQHPAGSVMLPADDWYPEKEADWQRTRAAGIMLPVQASVLFCLIGPSRLSALSINFFYYALFQAVLVATVKWLSGRWSVALLALGLLLLAKTPFVPAGGLFDFRLDFIDWCLYGIFLCLVIRSGIFTDRRWSLAAGACGALLFTFRFITLVYLAGTLAAFLAFLAIRLRARRNDVAERQPVLNQMRNALLAAAVIAGVAMPILAGRIHSIAGYYLVGHITGTEKQIRASEQGVGDLVSSLLFYPKSIYDDHGGHVLFLALGLLLLVGLIVRMAISRRATHPPLASASACVFVLAAGLAPLAALTADRAKSPVVADILLGPLVWLGVLAIAGLAGAHRTEARPGVIRRTLIALAVLILSLGIGTQVSGYARRSPISGQRADVERLMSFYDRIDAAAAGLKMRVPRFAFDGLSDALHYKDFQVLSYERHGDLFAAQEVLASSIFACDLPYALDRLRHADFVVLTNRPAPAAGAFELPFDRSMRGMKPRLFEWCRQNLVELGTEHLGSPFDCDVSLFARPQVRVEGEPTGWIGSRGTKVIALAAILRQRPNVELSGPLNPGPPATSSPTIQVHCTAGDSASITFDSRKYHLKLHVNASGLPRRGPVEIDLSFDPGSTGDSFDRRHVVRLPDRIELRP